MGTPASQFLRLCY